MEKVVALPTECKDLAIRAKRILLDLLKDHLIPHITGKRATIDMYDALETLCQSVNISRKMLLKNKLTSTA